MRSPLRWAMVGLLAACGGGPTASDAGTPDAAAETLAALVAPAPPMPLRIEACPPGWRTRSLDDGTRVCEPWADDEAPRCGETELALPGRGCEPIDTCPADGWPEGLPSSGVIYVRAGATDGDGTRGHPFGTLAAGLTAARGRDVTVALAEGEYEGHTSLELRNRALRGACASGTIIRDPETDLDEPLQAALTVRVAGARLEGVRIVGGSRALWIVNDASVDAENVILEGGAEALRFDSRAQLTGTRVRVVADALDTFAVYLRPSARLTLRECTLIGGRGAAVGARPGVVEGAEVHLSDCAVLDSRYGVLGSLASVTLARSALERLTTGITVAEGASATLTDARIRDVGLVPVSAALVSRGEVTATRTWASGAMSVGFLTAGERARTRLEDLVVEDVASGSVIVSALEGARVDIARARFVRSTAVALQVEDGSVIAAHDVVAEDFANPAVRAMDFGFVTRATMHLERVRVRDIQRVFVGVGAGGRLEASDVDVSASAGIVVQCAPEVGLGCDPGAESSLHLERARFRDVRRVAVALVQARASLVDVDIDGVTGEGDDGSGFGLFVNGSCDAARIRIRRAVRHGVWVGGDGSLLDASDLRVEATAPAACPPEVCTNAAGGDALLCALGGRFALTRFSLAGSFRSGLVLATSCQPSELRAGEITANAIGILTDRTGSSATYVGVRLHDNEQDYNTVDLVVTVPTIDP